MKIVYVDTSISGHHISYLQGLLSRPDNEYILILPENVNVVNVYKQYICNLQKKKLKCYLEWIRKIRDIIRKEKPDIVHFLYGDELYRFFGIGLSTLKCRVIVTCHQIRRSRLRDISFKRIAKSVDAVVVHTAKLKRDFEKMGVKNAVHIEYPKFNTHKPIDSDVAKQILCVNTKAPILLALGGTRNDKGLDILLDALSKVTKPFHLIIAGKEEDIKRDMIDEKIANYRDQVSIFLEFLSNEKLSYCLDAADIVVLPYRKSFDGASGPLGEGVALGKIIVGSNHGSLGDLIEENHLGYTFESENINSLYESIELALSQTFIADSTYKKYKNMLNPAFFVDAYSKLYFTLNDNYSMSEKW